MTIQEIRIGDKVQDRNGFEFEVVALFKNGTVHCDFDGNEADIWEFKVDELKRVVNDVAGQSEQLTCPSCSSKNVYIGFSHYNLCHDCNYHWVK